MNVTTYYFNFLQELLQIDFHWQWWVGSTSPSHQTTFFPHCFDEETPRGRKYKMSFRQVRYYCDKEIKQAKDSEPKKQIH